MLEINSSRKISKDIDLVALVISLEEAKEVLKQINIEFTERNNSHSRLQFERWWNES